MARTGDTPRARGLGVELREIRNQADLSTRQVGKLIGRNNVTITRWETGHYPPSVEDTATLLGALGITGEKRDHILEMARDAADPNWVAPGVDKQLAALTEFERTAKKIVDCSPLLIPGLLQTAEYARSIMTVAGVSRGEADQRVIHRLGRRDVLTRRNPVELLALIGEYALRYQPCHNGVALEQLRHIEQWAMIPNITVQAIPLGAPYCPALAGPFVLIEFEKTKPIVHLEHHRSSLSLYDQGKAKDVCDYQTAVNRVIEVAMSPDETTKLIADIADQMEITQ